MPSTFKLQSPIFDKAARSQVISKVVRDAAKRFKVSTKEKMTSGTRSGRVYARKRGASFRRAHRASARGERPAPDTLKLLNSIQDKSIGAFKSQVSTNVPYASILQEELDRPIMSERDAEDAQNEMLKNAEEAIKRLL